MISTTTRLASVAVALSLCGTISSLDAADLTVRLKVQDRTYFGNPLAWDEKNILLLGRDGQLLSLPTKGANEYRKVSDRFTSFSSQELRGELQNEFGHAYQISLTEHYAVVHPKGERDVWTHRFEDLYRSFVHYFVARGFRLDRPQFRMVAVVFGSRTEFFAYAKRTGDRIDGGVVGYYSPRTNRIAIYDQSAKGGGSLSWKHNADTIIHEAAHQSAFNTGIHDRFSETPRWVTEGLGTMFEAPGVWESLKHDQQADRINVGRYRDFRLLAERGNIAGTIPDLIASDRPFRLRPMAAYAQAWALSFYLAETHTKQYSNFLKHTVKRKKFSLYSETERIKDFKRFFGHDLKMLEARLVRFIMDLNSA